MERYRIPALLLALLVLPTAALGWQVEQSLLANEGRIFLVLSGSYGELFPSGQEAPARNRVLAVDELFPQGGSRRNLVPRTLGPDHDMSPSAAYDEAADSLALVWEKQFSNGATTVNLISFTAGQWSPMQELTGHTQSRKWSPRVAITQDGDSASDADRTVFHVIWAEGVFGYETTFYTPVLLLDGTYSGRNPVLRLADWNAPAGSSPRPGHSLLRTPSEDLGGDRGTLVVGTASAATGRLLSFDLKVHPEVTGKVADKAREEILATGDDSDLESMVADVRAHIIIAGVGFRPAALIPHLADAAEISIREHYGDGDLQSLSGLVRAHIIIAGDKWLFPRRNREGLRILDAAGGEGSWTHVVTLSPLSGRELPDLDPAAENPRILFSGDGREALVAWQRDGRWRYVESRGDGWTPTLSVHPHLGDDPEAIDRLFERRIRAR